jgi:hypothetical protein
MRPFRGLRDVTGHRPTVLRSIRSVAVWYDYVREMPRQPGRRSETDSTKAALSYDEAGNIVHMRFEGDDTGGIDAAKVGESDETSRGQDDLAAIVSAKLRHPSHGRRKPV